MSFRVVNSHNFLKIFAHGAPAYLIRIRKFQYFYSNRNFFLSRPVCFL